MMFAPLEQFKVIALLPLFFFIVDFSVTNSLIACLLISIFFLFFLLCLSKYEPNSKSFLTYVIPSTGQSLMELFNKITTQLLFDNLNKEGEKFYPYVCVLFFSILFCNLLGLIPYSFTLTSHIIITSILSFSVFIGVNLVGFKKHNLALFSLIIPANSSVVLALVLVPIEFLSYVVKPVSLGVRLFINLMAGHTLLKVIVGFSWSLLIFEDFLCFILHTIPLFLLVLLMALELSVALIQAYVFIVLTCIYLNDCINLH